MKGYMTRAEVAEALGIAVSSVRYLVKKGLLPEQRSIIGRGLGGTHVYYLPADVERLRAQSLFPVELKRKRKR